MGINRFENIIAWQEARKLMRMIYSATAKGGLSRDFGVKDQVQRASISVMTNIAEGFGSDSHPEFARFLSYARRSVMEVQSLLYASLDAGYLQQDQFQAYYYQSQKTIRLVSKFKSSLNSKR